MVTQKFLSYVFTFLLGMMFCFLIIMTSSVLVDYDKTQRVTERLSYVLASMDETLLEVRHRTLDVDARLQALENKINVQAPEKVTTETIQVEETSEEESQEGETTVDTSEEDIAVTQDGLSLPFVALSARTQEAVVGKVKVSVQDGSGNVRIVNSPFLGQDISTIASVASRVAASVAKVRFTDKDYVYKFDAPDDLLEDESVGAVLALGAYGAIDNLKVQRNVLVTGSVSSDATVGPVGNLYEKLRAAGELKYRRLVVPSGQNRVTVYGNSAGILRSSKAENFTARILDMHEHGTDEYSMGVKEVETVYDAIPLLLD